MPRSNTVFLIAIVLLLVLGASSAANAADRYLDCASGNDGAAGTIGAPWLTIAKYLSTAVTGDRLFIKGGTTCAVTNSSNRLQLKGSVGRYSTGANPIIDCSAITANAFLGCVHAGTSSTALTGITIQDIEVTGGRYRGIWLQNCPSCIARNVDIHRITGDTGVGLLVSSGSIGALIEGWHIYNVFVSAGSEVAEALKVSAANVIVQDGYGHDNSRTHGSTNPATGNIWRRNTILGHIVDDPNLYYTGGGAIEFDSNALLMHFNPFDTTGALVSLAVEPLGPASTRFIRNASIHHNILAYSKERGFVNNVLAAVATDPPSSQISHNNVWKNNTIVKIKCCGGTGDAPGFQQEDSRTPGDGTDWSSNTLKNSIFWAIGSSPVIALRDSVTLATCTHNTFETGVTFTGASNCIPTANNNVHTGAVPFVSFNAASTTTIGNPQNFNLTATTTALNSASDGRSRGALHPP